jgi:hypothetical protein
MWHFEGGGERNVMELDSGNCCVTFEYIKTHRIIHLKWLK